MPATSWSTAHVGAAAGTPVAGNGAPPRRRILIVCPEPPAPPTWGFALRVYNLARELSRHHDVSLLTYDTGDPTRDWAHLAELFTVHSVPAPARAKRQAQLRSLGSRTSFHCGRLLSQPMQQAITDLVAREHFDVIQVESSQMAGFAFPAGPVLVLDEHNIEHDLLGRDAGTERSLPRRLYKRIEQRKVRREEIGFWGRVSGCAVTSLDDERRLHDGDPSTRTCVVANGVDLVHFTPAPAATEPAGLVFVGSINYRPNTDAVLHCAEAILPLVRERVSTATLTVVGQGAPHSVRRLESPAVRIAGEVADVRPYLAAAAVVVVPLRSGGGTRIKVLEALAMGKAVVTTSLGCEGIEVEDGRHVLIADDPETFAACVVRLLGDEELSLRLGMAGRRLVESRYGWESVTRRLEAFHEQLIALQSRVPA